MFQVPESEGGRTVSSDGCGDPSMSDLLQFSKKNTENVVVTRALFINRCRSQMASPCPPTKAMKPPGGESSNLFGSPEEAAPSSRPNRMASNIFGPTAEPQNIPKRTHPPVQGQERSALHILCTEDSPVVRSVADGIKSWALEGGPASSLGPILAEGKGSGIFDESTPVQMRQRLNPPGGKTSDIFGSPVAATSPLAHPNKPKDHVLLYEGEDPKLDLKAAMSTSPREEPGEKGSRREAECTQEPQPTPTLDSHEPRLGPRPRSHNKVLNPPGGKSSISFY